MNKFLYSFFIIISVSGRSLLSQTYCIDLLKDLHNIDSSIYKLEKCYPTTKNDTLAYVKNSCYLANLYCQKAQFIKSEKELFRLFPLVKNAKHILLKALVFNHLGNCYKLSLEVSLALKNYLLAEEIYEKENSVSDLLRLYVDIAEYYRSLGLQSDAKRYIQRAFNTYQTSGIKDIPKLIRIYNRWAAISNESSPSDSSLLFSAKALNLSREIGDVNSQAISLNEIGFALKNRKKVDSSAKCYKQAILLWTKLGDDLNAIHAKGNLAMLYSHNYFPKDSIVPIYKGIIDLVTKKKLDYPLDGTYFGLSNCYFFAGDSLDSYRIRRKAYEALLEKNKKFYDIEVNNIKEKYENEKYREQINVVSDELEESEKNLLQKERENRIIYISLGALSLLLILIGFLLKRIYDNNKILDSKNKEKDGLIQEIHHRVKNNLQFVSSLINMQINSSKAGAEVDSLNDASRRIRSMALVHEMLYNQNNMEGIEIKKYLEELISSINEIVNSLKIPIKFTIDCEEFTFETPSAIALGMITSELVSNSIKYAFKQVAHPEIKIELKKTNNGFINFMVRDNGLGISEVKPDQKEKLGMRLISIFSRQIKGEYNFKNDKGLVYSLSFAYKKKK